VCLSIGTSRTRRGVHIGQIFRNEAYAGHQLQTCEAKMAKALMNGSQSASLPFDHGNKGFFEYRWFVIDVEIRLDGFSFDLFIKISIGERDVIRSNVGRLPRFVGFLTSWRSCKGLPRFVRLLVRRLPRNVILFFGNDMGCAGKHTIFGIEMSCLLEEGGITFI
jgi:hypothetical protein